MDVLSEENETQEVVRVSFPPAAVNSIRYGAPFLINGAPRAGY